MGILKTKKIIIYLLILLVNTSCWPTKDLKNFTLNGEIKKIDTSKLKVNGIYYRTERKESNPFASHDYVYCIVFYNDGTFLDLKSHEVKSDVISAIDEILKNFNDHKQRYSNYIDFWGAYKIVQDSIMIQSYRTWVMPRPGTLTVTAKVFNEEMKIQNDTTILAMNDQVQGQFDKYSLYKTQKPDSTNLFMTNKRIKRKLEKLYKKRHQ